MKITDRLYREFDPVFRAIAAKYTSDPHLAEDCVSETWAEVLRLPTRRYRMAKNRSAYLRTIARNTSISLMESYNTGKWYTGRKVRDTYRPARYVEIERLLQWELVQIDTAGRLLPGERSDEEGYVYTMQLDEGGMAVLLTL